MHIKFLGTGTPDFFGDSSVSKFHRRARHRGGRNWRYPSMLWLAPGVLIDFSRVAPVQMKRAGVNRDRAEQLLLTHSHDDHFDAAAIVGELLRPAGLKQVYGNEVVCGRLRQALAGTGLSPDSTVRVIAPHEPCRVGPLTVTALRANHCWINAEGEAETALNFILEGGGVSLLYLVDTRLPYADTHAFLRGYAFDAVIVDATFGDRPAESLSPLTGHLNFRGALDLLEAFDRDSLLRPGARKVFSHLSTGNVDLHDKVAPRLARLGVTLAYDRMDLRLRKSPGHRRRRAGRNPHWIWHPDVPNMENFYLYARRPFHLTQSPVDARLACTCRDRYQLYVNGAFVGRGPSPCDPSRQYYDEYDVTRLLRTGENVIAVLGYAFGEKTVSVIDQIPHAPGLRVWGEIRTTDGHVTRIASDSTWRVKRADSWAPVVSRINPWIGYRELYTAGADADGWIGPGFDDRTWLLPRIRDDRAVYSSKCLVPREIPFLRETEMLPETVLHTDRSTGSIRNVRSLLTGTATRHMHIDASVPGALPSILVDFGRTVVGYPVLKIGGNGGGTCILSYGESVDVLACDRIVLSGEPLDWSPFGRRAFRYLRLACHGGTSPIQIRGLGLRSVSFPVTRRGTFTCSDNTLNRIWQVSRDTIQSCMQDHFEDCPTREQALWLGDVLPGSRVAYYAFGETRLTRKCLRQLAAVQAPEGWIPAVGPVRAGTLIPDFCCYWVSILYEYYLHSGDRDLLEELYPALRRLLGWMKARANVHHLLDAQGRTGRQWWCFIDWAPIDKEGEVTALQCVYHQALLDAAAICRVLGKVHDVSTCRTEAAAVKASVNRRLWDPLRGFVDCRTETSLSKAVSEQTGTLAILSGIAGPKRTARILENLPGGDGITPSGTPFMKAFVAQALFRSGEPRAAINLIRAYWGEMLRRGATTFWEQFDPRTPRSHVPMGLDENHRAESLCHGWSSGPGYLLPAYVLGITPLQAGFRDFRVQPQADGLAWVEGRVPTPHGDIGCRWECGTQECILELSVPATCRAHLVLPLPTGSDLVRINRRTAVAGRDMPVSGGDLRCRGIRDGHVMCTTPRGGTYRLRLEGKA